MISKLTGLEQQVESLHATEFEIRRTLWLGHGHTGLYGDDGEMQCNLAGCFLDFKRAPLEKLISRVLELLGSLRAEWDELNASFDLRWKADIRAIARWREAHPGNELVMPDHADLCVWLLAERDASRTPRND